MINNLPSKFPLDKLNGFTFGNVEGKVDNLLNDPICICRIKPIEEFLQGEKSLIVGERGVGKTALFRLIADRKLEFNNYTQSTYIIVPIDEELQYNIIKNKIKSQLHSSMDRDDAIFRIVWEMFIIYRIILRLKDDKYLSTNDTLNKISKEYEDVFGKKKKLSLLELLSAQKKTVGMKVDTSLTGNAVPNMYLSVEPGQSGISENNGGICLDLEMHKKEINTYLNEINANIVVLLDKIDEFVIKEEYEAQKQILQGLLLVERSYDDYNRIKLNIFLRSDLFMKLDFDELGYDKVASKKVMLNWSNDDIRAFIARRIYHNYSRCFDVQKMSITIDESKLYLDKNLFDINYIKESNKTKLGQFLLKAERIVSCIASKIVKILFKKCMDSRKGKTVSSMDEIHRQFITNIFPRIVNHTTNKGKVEEITLFDFFETHFSLGTGNTTPRLVVMYLDKCLENIKSYYKNNPADQSMLDEQNEYPLIKRAVMEISYKEFQDLAFITFAKVSTKWERYVNLIKAKKGNKFTFSFNELKKMLAIDDISELNDLLAFLCHIGFFKCTNPASVHEERSYLLPIIFR